MREYLVVAPELLINWSGGREKGLSLFVASCEARGPDTIIILTEVGKMCGAYC